MLGRGDTSLFSLAKRAFSTELSMAFPQVIVLARVAASSNTVALGVLVAGPSNQAEQQWITAMTCLQMRQGIAMLLREVYQCDTMAHLLDACQQRLRRHTLEHF
jgi:hypothetical protein